MKSINVGIVPKGAFRKIAAAIAIAASLGSSASAFAGYYTPHCNFFGCRAIYVPTCTYYGCY